MTPFKRALLPRPFAILGWTFAIGCSVAPGLALAEDPQGPCPYFDEAMVRKIFPASVNDAELKRRERRIQTCTFTWTAQKGGRERKAASQGRLTLAKVAARVEAKDWERVLQGYGKQTLEPLPKLGTYAVWSEQRSQLSMIAKGHIFHVTVQDDDQPDAKKTHALAVADELIRRH